MTPVILSVFPGIDGLGRGFEALGDCVVRGPDALWGGDARTFHPRAGVFDAVIGGPPCQAFSRLVHIVKAKGQTPKPNLIPQFERIVQEAQPAVFVMENVEGAPTPYVPGYYSYSVLLDNHWFGAEQGRVRRITFGAKHEVRFDVSPSLTLLEQPQRERAVVATSSKEGALAKSQEELRDGTSRRLRREAGVLPGQKPRRSIERCCELQGFPADFTKDMPFTMAGKYQVVGNAVPRWMAEAIAQAVHRALGWDAEIRVEAS